MNPESHELCMLCRPEAGRFDIPTHHDTVELKCCNCGTHSLSVEAASLLPRVAATDEARARIAYGLRRLPEGAVVMAEQILRFADTPRPAPLETIDNLVLYLGRFGPGELVPLNPKYLRAELGCKTTRAADWALMQAKHLGWLTNASMRDDEMTSAGWSRFAELMHDAAGSQHAFMAMQFNDPQLDNLFSNYLRPAVKQTGFDLRRIDGPHQTAGLIDNRMRVEIRTSRFVVCELTRNNRGAYWEAGFAEGLGRPVFYLCREDLTQSADYLDRPHFDTEHQLILRWRPDNIGACMENLKALIRATLPGEATLED